MSELPSDAAVGWRYRFDGVELDLVARRLRIDGHDRAASQRALQLLEILCEQPGVLLSRVQLTDRLWPGGQVVSDEALTQIIFRTRAVLGPYAERVATVRGAGLRLDAQVWREPVAADVVTPQTAAPTTGLSGVAGADGDAASHSSIASARDANASVVAHDAVRARGMDGSMGDGLESTIDASPLHPVASPAAAAVSTSPSTAETVAAAPEAAPQTPPRANFLRRFAIIITLAVLTSIATVLLWQRVDTASTDAIDIGYGLDPVDAHATLPETADLLRDAFRQEADGDRGRARALLEAVHASDATTPLPALFLGLWAIGSGDLARADDWLAQARQRIAALRSPNLVSLLRYIEAERAGDARAVVQHAGAVLDQRPRAWQMRTARAHLLLSMDMREAALDELQQVDVDVFDHRKLAMAVADRASLGDVAGAEAVLARAQHTLGAPERAFLQGRIAWSAGDLAAAEAAFDEAIAAGQRRARFALMQRAVTYVGLLQMLQRRDAAAIASFDRANAAAQQARDPFDQFDLGLLLAQLHAAAGHDAAMRRHLVAVRAIADATPGGWSDGYLALFLVRLAPDLQPAQPAVEAPDGLALLAARGALRDGDAVAAGDALDRAIEHGALDGELADETRLLQAELGRTPAAEIRIDPPFPPLSRYAARHALALLQAAQDNASQ